MNENNKNLEPYNGKENLILDIIETVSSAIPYLGGPISSVLNNISFGKKINRIHSVLSGLSEELKDFESEVSINYVKTKDFEELLQKTLLAINNGCLETNLEVYKNFLYNLITTEKNRLKVVNDLNNDLIVNFSKSISKKAKAQGHIVAGRAHLFQVLLDYDNFFGDYLTPYKIDSEELNSSLTKLVNRMTKQENINEVRISRSCIDMLSNAKQLQLPTVLEIEYDTIWHSMSQHSSILLKSPFSRATKSDQLWIKFLKETANLVEAINRDSLY